MPDSSGKTAKSGGRFVRLIFNAIGLILIVVGLGFTAYTYDFYENAVPATGTVLSVERDYSSDTVTYRPTVRFVDVNGDMRIGQTFMSSSSYYFLKGAKIDIIYDVRNPETVRMNTWFALWGIGAMLIAGGFVPLIVARFIGRKLKRSKPAKPTDLHYRTRDEEEEFIEVRGRTPGLVSRESLKDHERETNYIPTVRRNR